MTLNLAALRRKANGSSEVEDEKMEAAEDDDDSGPVEDAHDDLNDVVNQQEIEKSLAILQDNVDILSQSNLVAFSQDLPLFHSE